MIRAVVVDDEAPARDRMRRLLDASGVTVVGEAADGDTAVAQIDALAPDLVFLDIQMPIASGLDVAARVRAPKPRIVFCTAFDRFAVEAFEHHAVDYLLKPVNRARLARTLERVSRDIVEQRRRSRELSEAARAQARLTPALPATEGLDVAGLCIPAHGVGGDYYDLLPLGEGRIAAVLADVSGKGLYAGIIAAALQARLQTIVARGSFTPAAALSELNRLTVGTIDTNRFATVFLAAVDPRASTLLWANGGHTPALLVSATGVRTLRPTGPVVGWSRDSEFAEAEEPFRHGDVLAAFSDGLTEVESSEGVELGEAGVAGLVQQYAPLSADRITHSVVDAVAAYAGATLPHDDRTIVVVKR